MPFRGSFTSREQVSVYEFSWLATVLIPLAAIFIQAFLPTKIRWLPIIDLPMMVVIFFAVARRNPISGCVTGAIIGLLQDLLGGPAHRLLDRALVALCVRGVVSGSTFELPVQYAAGDNAVVVLPGKPETKSWWRNLVDPAPVEVLLAGRWQPGYGIVLHPGEPGYDAALNLYRQRWPRAAIPAPNPLEQVRFTASLNPAAARTPPTPPAAECATDPRSRPESRGHPRPPR